MLSAALLAREAGVWAAGVFTDVGGGGALVAGDYGIGMEKATQTMFEQAELMV